MKTSAERRHHAHRIFNKIKNYFVASEEKLFSDKDAYEKHLRKIAKTKKPCSCYMCGNPRKYLNEKSIQEKRFDNEKFD